MNLEFSGDRIIVIVSLKDLSWFMWHNANITKNNWLSETVIKSFFSIKTNSRWQAIDIWI